MSERTERTYRNWIIRYVNFCGRRHPRDCGTREVRGFLEHLAQAHQVAARTQNQALAAIHYLYRQVLDSPLADLSPYARGKRGDRVPEVLEPDEVARVFTLLEGTPLLIAQLLYGTGLRLSEALGLRAKDLSLPRHCLFVRDGKGGKDRRTVLPTSLVPRLTVQLAHVRRQHAMDLAKGGAGAYLPGALSRNNPGAVRDWRWAWLFPSHRFVRDRDRGLRMRWHVHPSTMQRALAAAARAAGVHRRVTPHIFRHSFATQLLRSGYDIRTVQSLLGHRDVATTMLYLHVLETGVGVRSPLDQLGGAAAGGAGTQAVVPLSSTLLSARCSPRSVAIDERPW